MTKSKQKQFCFCLVMSRMCFGIFLSYCLYLEVILNKTANSISSVVSCSQFGLFSFFLKISFAKANETWKESLKQYGTCIKLAKL